jgi:hypothetical protein
MKIDLTILVLSLLNINLSSAADSIGKQPEQHNLCMQACNTYYQQNGNLTDFKYYADAFASRNDRTQTKQEFYSTAKSSMDQCYATSSSVYSTCKSFIYSLSKSMTSNTSIQDWFSSCKSKCTEDLEAFLSTPDEPTEQHVEVNTTQRKTLDWVNYLNPEDKYTVIFKTTFSGRTIKKKIMTGQEIKELAEDILNRVSKTIAMDRITLVNGEYAYVNPNTIYHVVISNPGGSAILNQQTGEDIANSTEKYISISE